MQVLAGTTRALTGREVHRLAGTGSESGVRSVLARLANQGLVHATDAGQATLYVANRDHVAWAPVEALTRLRQTLLGRFTDLVRKWEEAPITVAVFGSAARGDGDVESDIDILLVHRNDCDGDRWQAQVDILRERVYAWSGNVCQAYDLSESEYANHVEAAEPIVAEWRREAILVHGEPLAQLARTRAVG